MFLGSVWYDVMLKEKTKVVIRELKRLIEVLFYNESSHPISSVVWTKLFILLLQLFYLYLIFWNYFIFYLFIFFKTRFCFLDTFKVSDFHFSAFY